MDEKSEQKLIQTFCLAASPNVPVIRKQHGLVQLTARMVRTGCGMSIMEM
jgi:hypothetical protein